MLSKLLLAPVLALVLWIDDEPFQFEFSSQTDPKGQCYVVVHANESVSGLAIRIEGDNGRVVTKTLSTRKGKDYKITWNQKQREVSYRLNIKGGDVDTDFSFDVHRAIAGGKVKAPKLLSSAEDIVDRHKVNYKTSFTMSSYKFQVYNTDGVVVADQLVTDKVINAGSTFTVSWNSPEDVFLLHLKGEDEVGRFAEAKHVPWSADIPHTEVNFDSGKWDIKEEQEPKLDDAFAILVYQLAGIDRANEAVKGGLTTQLYIVGYTDTVGGGGDNQVLSNNRAREIAQYFIDKGAWCEVWYAGMGERGLAVHTGDSVDEVRNRRARYILQVDRKPSAGDLPSGGAWKRLAEGGERTLGALPSLPKFYVEKLAREREERIAKFGAGDGSPMDDDDDDDDDDRGSVGGEDDVDLDPLGDDEGPRGIRGRPGATGKGCSVTAASEGALVGTLALLGLLGIAARRRDP